jgi:Rab11 family-interacting protein 1/2/5
MWSPTHVQVLVKRARGLTAKGKAGTNDAFVTIGVGKEKYATSVKEHAPAADVVEWGEQCELAIPQKGNTAQIKLTVLHRNLLGADEFLGLVIVPLSDLEVRNRSPFAETDFSYFYILLPLTFLLCLELNMHFCIH